MSKDDAIANPLTMVCDGVVWKICLIVIGLQMEFLP